MKSITLSLVTVGPALGLLLQLAELFVASSRSTKLLLTAGHLFLPHQGDEKQLISETFLKWATVSPFVVPWYRSNGLQTPATFASSDMGGSTSLSRTASATQGLFILLCVLPHLLSKVKALITQ